MSRVYQGLSGQRILVPVVSGKELHRYQNETKNAKNNLDWEGVYTGRVLLDQGHVADVRIKLNRDQSLEYNREYVDKAYDVPPLNFTAPFRWDDTGNIIMMDAIDVPVQYKVERDKLIRLDEDNFVLKKVH